MRAAAAPRVLVAERRRRPRPAELKLTAKKKKKKMVKRARPRAKEMEAAAAAEEASRRARHLRAISDATAADRELEELVFGDSLMAEEGELLQRLAGPQMKSCLPANQERLADGKLSTVQFHPSAQVVMTAGRDRSVSLFQVDGIRNPKIQSIYLESFPIYKARFSADGEQVIATGTHHKVFYVYDMMGGSIIPVHQVREEGEVFIWDVRSRKCLHKFEDEGSLEGKCIAVSKNNQYVACGSVSGVVNLYTTDVCLKENHPKPVKAIMNLVTSATSVTFNPTTEILAVASNEADEAVKLVETLFRFLKDTGENGLVSQVL
ncbi:hypothetical protein CIB84_001340 [Bambusicola thoracicus]|uniref:UTP18 small subunit processome component n=1 Tax=Bambusicola thoracicus TaxID=9083 RepID=A0A2P4TF22_BAMTH|nr:hypothetical protein CIB84_001340 [Bambusicola thoracicus]